MICNPKTMILLTMMIIMMYRMKMNYAPTVITKTRMMMILKVPVTFRKKNEPPILHRIIYLVYKGSPRN